MPHEEAHLQGGGEVRQATLKPEGSDSVSEIVYLMNTCSHVQKNPIVSPLLQHRFILDDGSGNGHLYANDDLVMDVLGVAQREWAELNEIVIKTGYLAYSKAYSEQPQVSSRIIAA